MMQRLQVLTLSLAVVLLASRAAAQHDDTLLRAAEADADAAAAAAEDDRMLEAELAMIDSRVQPCALLAEDCQTDDACDCELGIAGCRTTYWARAEYLYWGSDGMHVPALATTGASTATASTAGVLGVTGTQVLFGNSGVADRVRSGGRFEVGAWLNPDQVDGVSLTYLFLGDVTTRFNANQASRPILARPFFNVVTNAQDARLINFTGVVQGSLTIEATSSLQSAALDYRGRWFESPSGRFDCLVGYRFAQLADNLTIREQTTSLSGATSGSVFNLIDSFDTKNDFHGVELGVASTERFNANWSGDFLAKGALGGVFSTGRVFGRTDVTANNVTSISDGGLLALGANSGTHRNTHVGAVWDLGLRLRRRLGANTALVCGYDWFLWTRAQRAGDQIDLGVNTSQIPPGSLSGEPRPRYLFGSSSYWAQGLSLGLEASF